MCTREYIKLKTPNSWIKYKLTETTPQIIDKLIWNYSKSQAYIKQNCRSVYWTYSLYHTLLLWWGVIRGY